MFNKIKENQFNKKNKKIESTFLLPPFFLPSTFFSWWWSSSPAAVRRRSAITWSPLSRSFPFAIGFFFSLSPLLKVQEVSFSSSLIYKVILGFTI